MHPTVSFIIPTFGDRDLRPTLDSIEIWPGDEVLVINLHRPKRGGNGGPERTFGMRIARGDYLSFMDDDDTYTQYARKTMHTAACANPAQRPILFRMRYPSGRMVWDKPVFRCGNVGSPCIFLPNIQERLPDWDTSHQNDFNFLNSLNPPWEHRSFIYNDSVIADISHEDARWRRCQGLPVPQELPV